MKISVVTINLNNKKGLERTIESVINQTFFDKIEYIVVDGKSTDGSVELIEKYKNSFSFIIIEKDKGIYNAMNKGIDAANGEYIIFLNSGDEFYESNVIEKCYHELDKDIVYGNLLVKDDEKKFIKQPFIKKYPDSITAKYMENDSVPHNGSFIRLELLKREKYNEHFKIVSDWAFFYKKMLLDKCSYKHIDIIVSKFYLGGASSDERQIKIEKNQFYDSLKNYDYEICVIIPCFNQGKYVKETIDSLRVSTYKDFHCVIVNDGSTDDSENIILDEISGDSRFEYYDNVNHGLAYTRNFGISKTNSKYILCLDSDDKISPTYIENGIKYLNENPNVSIYYGKAKMFYDDGTEKDWNLPKFSYSELLKHNIIYCSHIYRREDYNRCGGYDEKMSGYEDWDFLIRLLHNNDKVYRTDDVVFFYRRHEDSMDFREKKNFKQHKEYIINKNKNIFLDNAQNKSNNDNIDIYIATHKDFKPLITKSIYKVVNMQKINNDVWNGIKGRFYSEIMSYFYVAENCKLKEYIGFCHYKKYWEFLDEIPDIDNLIKKYGVIAAKRIKFSNSIKEQYKLCHNIEDLYIISGILAEKYPNYVNTWNSFLNSDLMFPYNMFIMKKEEFLEYIKFIKTILDEYINIVGIDINKRINDNKEKYLKDFYPNSESWYQYRIGEYLAERLTNVWLLKNHDKIATIGVKITNSKYGTKKESERLTE
jgi:glycosyltransferase involved in cell wall biosynthesis